MERKLTAILSLDVVGYTRLMEADEEGTLALLKTRRKLLFEPTIRRYRGDVIKLMGDGILAQFPSVASAIECAIIVQKLNESKNENLNDVERMHLRIGITIGDVILDDGDVYGNGVNIAVRLQSIARPGSICISGAAREQAHERSGITFRHRGREQLRNIAAPVEVFEVDQSNFTLPQTALDEPAQAAFDRPSLAVLPFENIDASGSNHYFSDGITRDLIAELSRFRSLFVISATSSFQLRGGEKGAAEVGRALGARYVCGGSVQKTESHLRVTAELFDASSGVQVWSERYKEDLTDLTALQDALARSIASTLNNRLEHAELALIRRKPPSSLKSYDLWLQGAQWHEGNAPNDYVLARQAYLKAIEADPGFARAYASLAELSYMESVLSNWGDEAKDDCAEAAKYARRAIELDDQDANGHAVMGWIHMVRREFPKAIRHWNLVEKLNPNDADLTMWRATAHAFLGDAQKGIEAAELAMRLNPLFPDWYLSDYAVVLFFARRFEEMLEVYSAIPELFPHTPGWRAAALAHLGKLEEARDRAAVFARNIQALWSGSKEATAVDYGRWFARCIPLRQRDDRAMFEDGLRLAGLL